MDVLSRCHVVLLLVGTRCCLDDFDLHFGIPRPNEIVEVLLALFRGQTLQVDVMRMRILR